MSVWTGSTLGAAGGIAMVRLVGVTPRMLKSWLAPGPAGPMFAQDYTMQAGAQAAEGFHRACVERHIDLKALPISRFESVTWVFRSLVDMPADMHIDTVRFGSRHP